MRIYSRTVSDRNNREQSKQRRESGLVYFASTAMIYTTPFTFQ